MRVCLAFLLIVLAACAPSKMGRPDAEIEARARQMDALSASRTVSVVPGQYLGAQVVPRSEKRLPAIFSDSVTLRSSGTLAELASKAGSIMGLRVRIEQDRDMSGEMAPSNDALITTAYTGTFQGLLDLLASRSGTDWDYESSEVIFSFFRTRTFTLTTAPGAVRYEAGINNRSADAASGSASGQGLGSPVSGENSELTTSQASQTRYQADAWADAEKGVKELLSPAGRMVVNIAAGTLTVTDTAAALRRISSYIETCNAKLSRQVALTVKVYTLDVDDKAEAGLNLQAAFSDGHLGISSVLDSAHATLLGAGSVTATVLDTKLVGSSAMLKALQSVGKTTLLTSGTGVTTSGQPLPLQVMDTDTYLASISTETSNDNQVTSMVPGRESTGFAMTILPHILDQRRVILECNISLSSLERLDEFESGTAKIQLPKVSTRSFSQRVNMLMGQTLVLAGFEKSRRSQTRGLGLLSFGVSSQTTKTLLVLTLEVESVGS